MSLSWRFLERHLCNHFKRMKKNLEDHPTLQLCYIIKQMKMLHCHLLDLLQRESILLTPKILLQKIVNLMGCQLGKRSMMAATDLLASGFTGLTDIAGGYAAWTQNGLPTER